MSAETFTFDSTMPPLGESLLDFGNHQNEADQLILMQIHLCKGQPRYLKKNFMKLCKREPQHGEPRFIVEKGTTASKDTLIIQARGSLYALEKAYHCFPEWLGYAAETRIKLLNGAIHGKKLAASYYSAADNNWSKPVSICARWLDEAEEASFRNSFNNSENLIKNKAITGRQSESQLQDSRSDGFSSRGEQRKFQISDSKREMLLLNDSYSKNHAFDNVKFRVVLSNSYLQDHSDRLTRIVDTVTGRQPLSAKSNVFRYYDELGKLICSNEEIPKKREKMFSEKELLPKGGGLVKVEGIDWKEDVSAKELCQLFSIYGNISIAVMIPSKQVAFMNYDSKAAADNAAEYLDGITIAMSKLRVSRYPRQKALDAMDENRFTTCNPKKRYASKGAGMPKVTNHVSTALHVNLLKTTCPNSIMNSDIAERFSVFSAPMKVTREPSGSSSNMWSIEYQNSEQSCRTLMMLHGRTFKGGILRVTFTSNI